jgi:hypothetical protein
MDFSGLIKKYPVNRRLSQQEQILNLQQKQRLDIEPRYQLSIIKLNSNYLDSVDKWFAWKGILTAFAMVVIFMVLFFLLGIVQVTLTSPPSLRSANDNWLICAVVAGMISPVVAFGGWMLKKESFAFTHYPIRFDRKNRMVHVFRTNGSILSTSWDDIFFTLGCMNQWNEWEVRGHVLGADNVTVLETFALSYVGSVGSTGITAGNLLLTSQDFVRAHWEFIRRYMEDGPESVSSYVQFCMPVDGRRESFSLGAERIFANFAGAPFVVYWMMFPFCLVISLFRWFAMRTSRIPHWPLELEDSCRIETDDPYAIKGAPDGERVAVFPESARAAGVCFSYQTILR